MTDYRLAGNKSEQLDVDIDDREPGVSEPDVPVEDEEDEEEIINDEDDEPDEEEIFRVDATENPRKR